MYPYFFIGYQLPINQVDENIVSKCRRFLEEEVLLQPIDGDIKLVTFLTGIPKESNILYGETFQLANCHPITYKQFVDSGMKIPKFKYIDCTVYARDEKLKENEDFILDTNTYTIKILWDSIKDTDPISIRMAIDVLDIQAQLLKAMKKKAEVYG
jgi:hypothetical protein